MSRQRLWTVSVRTAPEAEGAVSEFLTTAFAQPACSFTDVETGVTTVTVYLTVKPDWSRAKRAELAAGIKAIRNRGLDVGSGRLSVAKVRHQDWAESWKRHFKPIEVGSALLIKPTWSKRSPRREQAVVVLDPGLSFGTGQHPTTAFCLEQLVAQRRPGEPQSFLDVGTGSGILAIAAAKLGYAPVHALDSDPEAVRTAWSNARQNRVDKLIQFVEQDVARLPRRPARKESLVCANLVSSLLVAQRDRLVAHLQAKGVLVVAGILRSEFSLAQRAYETAGLRLIASRTGKDWRSGSFRCG